MDDILYMKLIRPRRRDNYDGTYKSIKECDGWYAEKDKRTIIDSLYELYDTDGLTKLNFVAKFGLIFEEKYIPVDKKQPNIWQKEIDEVATNLKEIVRNN